jgi:3-hydroxy acid dehydrogenase/malonic semialdehyde reductase
MNILITGASSGIGAAVARRYAALGHHLILCARREDRLKALAATLGDSAEIVLLDVRNRTAVERELGTREVDILINNAGLASGMASAQTAEGDAWQAMIDTNVTGFVHCARAVLPGMVIRNRGHLVSLSSVAGTYPYAGGNVYGATKAFVTQFSQSIRSDLLGTRVRVTNIEPGMVETEFSVVRFGGDEAKAKSVYAKMKPLTAEDIAECIVWATSLPAHVNINRLEVMPVDQAFGGFSVNRV